LSRWPRSTQGKEPQVPPLRFAPVGDDNSVAGGQVFLVEAGPDTTELSSRPELRRSVVEGPAVLPLGAPGPPHLVGVKQLDDLGKIRLRGHISPGH
jgi:hypothetical protein